MIMPYYKSLNHPTVDASVNSATGALQTSLFTERIGFRSRPKDGFVTTLLPSGQAERYSWLDDYNAIKARTYQSAHPELASLFKKDRGHVWDLATCEFSDTLLSYDLTYRNAPYIKATNVRPVAQLASFRNRLLLAGTDNELTNYAALEYGRTAPTSDQISMSSIIGELREGLPALIPLLLKTGSKRDFKSTLQRQTRRARDAGSDYLNAQFGWIPLLSDVRSIATALATATAAISGDNLETHRRRFKPEKDETLSGSTSTASQVLHENSTTFETTGTGSSVTIGGLLYSVWVSQRHEIDYSFEAEFIRLPEGQKDYSSYIAKLDELMRWDLTPMDLWQLAPWSWLVDWFFDIGGQLDAWNSATSNRILSLYAYGMRDERLTTTAIFSNVRGQSADYRYSGPSTWFTQTKARRRQRIKANPFGFTPDPLTLLSAGQLAILAALGLTKVKR
jgi:hypothetical protein